MDLQTALSFPAAPDLVAALFADHDYVTARCEATGALTSEVAVSLDGDGAGFSVHTVRTFPTDDFPSFARNLIGAQVTIVQEDRWEPAHAGAWAGRSTVTTTGAPARVDAHGLLEAVADGSRQSITGTISAPPVPLLGAKIEKMVHDQIMKALAVEARLAAEWLTR